MDRKNDSPILIWAFWGILVLGTFLIVIREYFVDGFAKDTSNISYLIAFFFMYGFAVSLKVAIYLQKEYKALERMLADQCIGDTNASDAAALLESAMTRIRSGDHVELRSLIATYGATLKTKVDNVSVISGMLVTIGLLGTVLGLIITINGLGDVLSVGATDYAAMKAGLNKTVSGMGTAFFTTLMGALLGGVVLKVLGAEMRRSATELVAHTQQFSELHLATEASRHASEALNTLETRVAGLGKDLELLGNAFSSVIETVDTRHEALATGLDELVASVNQAVQTTHDEARERINTLTTRMDESVNQSDERLVHLVDKVEQSIDLSRRDAEERLNTKTSALAKKLTEAANLLAALSASSDETTGPKDIDRA